MAKNGTAPKEAIDFFRSKGWKVGFDYRDVWNEEHAHAFTVAKATTLDVLESVRGAVDDSLANGKTFQEFKKNLQPELERLGWWGKKEAVDPKDGVAKKVQLGSPHRLKTIYQTNMRTARAAGKWEKIERTKALLPYLRYSLGPSEKHRPEHAALEGTILPADDPWWNSYMPPNGWGCKCWVQQLSEAQAERAGGVSARPNLGEVEWFNERTGERERVPRGVTPGFNSNPGRAREQEELQRFKGKLNTVSPDAATAVHRAWMQPDTVGRWRENPKGNFPVAVMDKKTQGIMGAKQHTVYLSGDTMKKQDGNTSRSAGHSELSNEDYCRLPDLIARGTAFREDGQNSVYYRHDGKLFRAVVKTTKDKKENYVQSFHRAEERHLKQARKKFEVLREGEE
ncbi:MAG: phage minor head protein [Kiritimatiellales bacterium]